VEEVFAGFVVGFALSIIIAPTAAILLVRSNQETGFAQRVAPPGTNIIALSMFLHFLAFLLLTALGMIMGLALGGIEDRRPAAGLGSPNLVYTLLVIAIVAVVVIPLLVMPWRRYAAAAGFLLLVGFGWVTPWLAQAA
jgi:hypothetical protein